MMGTKTSLVGLALVLVLASVQSVSAGSHCDPYDELRCAGKFDRQNCQCLGGGPPRPQTDPCATAADSRQAAQCVANRIDYLRRSCAQEGRGWNAKRLDYWDTIVVYATRWNLSKPQRPTACD